MKTKIALSTNSKHHLWLGVFLGIWIFLFLVLTAPFDAASLSIDRRVQVMIFYGIFFMFSYFLIIPLQKALHRKLNNWTIASELGIVSLVFLITFFPSYIYYKSDLVNGDYSLIRFIIEIFIPFNIIMIPFVMIARWSIYKYGLKNETFTQKITLSGENNLDILHVLFEDIICIKSAQNYVEIYYLKNGALNKKLLRTTLKKVNAEIPDLLQVHRSYLINSSHFTEWKDKKSISLNYLTVPVSDKYKDQLLSLSKIHP